jgi:hypothetical protein
LRNSAATWSHAGITIEVAPDVAYRKLDGLPSTIRLGPCRLEITGTNPQGLFRQLMELAQVIAIEGGRPHGAGRSRVPRPESLR